MLDSLILLKLAALGCFGIIIIAIASYLRWIEEESYKNADGPKASTGLINDEITDPCFCPCVFLLHLILKCKDQEWKKTSIRVP